MADMTLQEAARVAGNMKGHFRAFEKLEGMLLVARDLETLTVNLERKAENAQETLDAILAAIKKAEDDQTAAEKRVKERAKAAQAEFTGKINNLKKRGAEERAKLATIEKDAADRATALKKDNQKLVEDLQRRVTTLRETEAKLEKSIQNLQKRVAAVEV